MDAKAYCNSSFFVALARRIRIYVFDVEQSAETNKNSRCWPKQDRLMDQPSYRRRIRGLRDFRKPSRIPFLAAPERTFEENNVTVDRGRDMA
jgi:hypothetical protein